MSLEAVIADNTSAIRELIAALTASAKAAPVPTAPLPDATAALAAEATAEAATAIQEAVKARPTSAKTKATPAPTPPTAAAPPDAAPEQKAASSEPPAAPTTYAEVVAAVTKVANAKGRDAAVGVFAAFGVANGKELKPEQYAAVVAACAKAVE